MLRHSSYGEMAAVAAIAQRNFFYVRNVILMALTEFLRNFPYGNIETATAARQRKAGNQA